MLKKHTSNKINKIGATTRVAKTIINNSNLIDAKQMAEKIGLLKKDIKQVREQNWLASFFPVSARSQHPDGPLFKKYVYFTIPVNKVKQDLYKMVFNPDIKDGSLNKKTRAKITPVFEEALTNLGIEAIRVPSYVLKMNNTSSIFKAEINAPAFALIIENARKKKPTGKTAFISEIADKRFHNAYSKNDEHPRVYNMFTQMPSSIRQHVFKNIYGVDMVEIDLTNSIVQCLASHGKCTKMLESIKTNTLLPEDQDLREETKEKLLTWIFSLVSDNVTNRWITRCKNQLREFLTDDYFEEMESFIQAIDNLDSPHTLFHYENVLREFCKQHPVCISLHDAVFIPANRADLIKNLTSLLDSQKYFYKINPL